VTVDSVRARLNRSTTTTTGRRIPGTRSVAHLEENLAAGQSRLTETDLAELDELVRQPD
jgi:aryl-alcohol dehydrogenase-like predicted oxidoreductase